MPCCFHVSPCQKIHGDITVPGDKSISHRAIILSAIADGITTIENLSDGTDVLATIDAMRALGVDITLFEKGVKVHGVGLHGLKPPKKPIDCGNSGTAMRLLCGLLSAQSFDSVLIGDASLMKRPMARIAEPLRLMGAKIALSSGNTAPIEIKGGQHLIGIDYMPAVASAQVKSGILLASLYATGKTTVRERIQTRDHTERMLQTHTHTHTHIPGDISAAAFFIVLASITKDADMLIRNVGVNPFRTGIIAILKLMGASIEIVNERFFGLEPVADIRVRYAPLQGVTIPQALVASAIDEFPVIFIAAAVANGKTILRNAAELRVKESDRIAVMAKNLKGLGVDVEELEDGIVIEGGRLQGGRVDACHDHRIAMAFSVAAAVANAPISIDNCDLVKTSFPTFIETAKAVGLEVGGSVIRDR